MSRKKLLLGNWKMYRGPKDAGALAMQLAEHFSARNGASEVVVFPPTLSLHAVQAALLAAKSTLSTGVQNVHWEKEGAFTGEVSATFAKDAGATHVLIAHSERRQYFGETDETANRRVKAVLAAGLVPVLCVGETLDERDAGRTEEIVARQLRAALSGIEAAALTSLIVAYEPVWAIGTGRVATPEQAQAVHAHLRRTLEAYGATLAAATPIVYGGSVKPDNAASLMSQVDIDGGLVGGASLDAQAFFAIAQALSVS
jgi:triosephosphate isomerase (TIM)